jgi:predicted AAA+ superfamily ATPase
MYFDLLESDLYIELLASPQRLDARIPGGFKGWVVLDEVQKIPALLDEVHRLIEKRRLKFVLTGSSARKLRRKGVNLLAGRAITLTLHPLTRRELGGPFDLKHALRYGGLPTVWVEQQSAEHYLKSYAATYLREEVQQEGLTRNIAAFSRFLEAASFSQGAPLNMSMVARDCHVERKLAESYFEILEDLLLATRLPIFTKRAKRHILAHPKFYYFDVGVYRALRPRGPLDAAEEVEGAAIETLVFQELRAANAYSDLGYTMHYWATRTGAEVDFVMYGERGLRAFEVKRSSRVRQEDLASLELFRSDYPAAKTFIVYGGARDYHEGRVQVLSMETFLRRVSELLAG